MPDLLVSLERLGNALGVTFSAGSDGSYHRALDLLAQSSNLVRTWGNPEWDDTNVPGRAADIAVQAAKREWTNPDGANQKSVGDVSVSYSRAGVQGAMYLTKDEKRDLRRLAGITVRTVELVTPWSGDEQDES